MIARLHMALRPIPTIARCRTHMMPLLLTSLTLTLAFIGPRRSRVSTRTLLIYGAGICVPVGALVALFLTSARGKGRSFNGFLMLIDRVEGLLPIMLSAPRASM